MWVKGELLDDFSAARKQARGGLDADPQPHPYDRLDWFERVWTHCPPGKAPLFARARADNSEAWLFLARTDAATAVALQCWYTIGFRPIFAGESSDDTKAAQLVALARRLKTGLSTITLEPVPERDGSCDLILSAFRRAGWFGVKTPKTGNWFIELAGKTFAEYWKERPGELRSTVDRKRKKFSVTTKIYTTFDANAWAEYEAIYQDSWKGEEGSPPFLRDWAKAAGQDNSLRLGIATLEGQAVAAQFWTSNHGHATIHKLAYREAAKESSAGTILSAAMFEHVIDQDRVGSIDYGTGDDSYKASWMDQRDQLYSLCLYNRSSLSGLIGAAKAMLSNIVRRPNRG